MIPQSMLFFLLRIIYYGGFLLFPLLCITCTLYFFSSNTSKFYLMCLLTVLIILMYARFIEPYRIRITKTKLSVKHIGKSSSIRIVLCADMHLGMYKGAPFLKRIVKKINALHPDLILMPGDFIYEPRKEDLSQLFKPLKELSAPVYAVTGNHDAEEPGHITSTLMREVLGQYIHVIDNQEHTIEVKGIACTIIGLSDIWEGKTNFNIISEKKSTDPTIILLHNPDGTHQLPPDSADLVVSGHTHGGQIRIPFLYHSIIPSDYGFNKGWYEVHHNPVFVTSGLGEVVLPMRLGVPPEIVVIELVV